LSADEREQVAQGLNILRNTFQNAIEVDCNSKGV
jgi:hypothetical protein